MLTSAETGALLERAVSGDRHAFDQLTIRVGVEGRELCTKILGDRDDVEDAIQAALLKVLRHRGPIDPARGGYWLVAVLRNACVDAYRTRRLRRGREGALACDVARRGEPSPLERLCAREGQEEASRALEGLEEPLRETSRRVFVDGDTYEQCAAIQGVPVNTVKSRLYAARRKLREALA